MGLSTNRNCSQLSTNGELQMILRAGARGLAMPEEHPRGGEQELAVVAFHYFLAGGGSWNTVTEIFSKARPSMAFLTRPLMEGM